MVTATDPAIIEREKADRILKDKAFASRADLEDFKGGFILPLDHPVRTSPFGVQRVLNGEPKAPHYGVDLAAPVGTPIHAPAPGLVVLAEPDLYLDGGLTLIDHGQGLISMYLHQSRIDVKAGDRVAQRQPIGLVGMKGPRHRTPSLLADEVAGPQPRPQSDDRDRCAHSMNFL